MRQPTTLLIALLATCSPLHEVCHAEPRVSTNGASDVRGSAERQIPHAPATSTLHPLPSANSGVTLEALQELALTHNPTLEQARAETLRTFGRQVQGGLWPNPQVAYSASEIGQDGRSGQQGFYVSQEFVTGGKLRLNQAVAGFERDQANQLLSAQEYRVLNDVRGRFYEVLVADRRYELAQELVEVAQNTKRLTDVRRQQGEGTKLDQLRAEITLEQVLLQATEAENRKTAAWRRLESVVGVPGLAESNLMGNLEQDLSELTWDDAWQRLRQLSPQIAQAHFAADRARTAVCRAEVQVVPNVTVSAGTQYDYATRTQIANVNFGLPLPIFNRNQGNIQAAEAEWIRAAREVDRTELALKRALSDAYQVYATRHKQVRRYRQAILPAAQQALDASRQAYEGGQINLLEHITLQTTYSQTRLAYLESLAELWQSIIIIDGLLLSDGLTEPAAVTGRE